MKNSLIFIKIDGEEVKSPKQTPKQLPQKNTKKRDIWTLPELQILRDCLLAGQDTVRTYFSFSRTQS